MGLGALSLVSAAGFLGCSSSSDGDDGSTGGTGATAGTLGVGTGGSTNPEAGGSGNVTPASTVVGSFDVMLNPAIATTGPFTTISGKVFAGVNPSDIAEVERVKDANCAVYEFSVQSCTDPTCTVEQACVAMDTCVDKPGLVSIGDVTVSGVGGTDLKLKAINKNYQYPLDITYPGFAEGDTITLTATGDFYPAQTISAKGVAPLQLSGDTYRLSKNTALELAWTPGGDVGAKVTVVLNISKHGGSPGYLKCEVSDTGSLTIPADQITALMNLGVAGFPELMLTRSTQGESKVDTGSIRLNVASRVQPTLEVDGYCSCFDSGDCGSCSDTTKTTCNTVTKLCYAP